MGSGSLEVHFIKLKRYELKNKKNVVHVVSWAATHRGWKTQANKIWETTEINLCSQSLRVKKVKIIYTLAAGKNVICKAFFFPRKLKHCGHTENLFFPEMRRKLLVFNYRISVFPKNTGHDHIYFLVKYKIPRLHSGMINAARFLFQSQGFNLQLFA